MYMYLWVPFIKSFDTDVGVLVRRRKNSIILTPHQQTDPILHLPLPVAEGGREGVVSRAQTTPALRVVWACKTREGEREGGREGGRQGGRERGRETLIVPPITAIFKSPLWHNTYILRESNALENQTGSHFRTQFTHVRFTLFGSFRIIRSCLLGRIPLRHRQWPAKLSGHCQHLELLSEPVQPV